jgi:ubiquinone/menaquinone biosynthesis C-methylase UbiE
MEEPVTSRRRARSRSWYRIRYYDAFARVYDRFVAAHSSDRDGRLRDTLADRAEVEPGDRALDLRTGTGAMLPPLAGRAGAEGLVIGLDFSRGMLERARAKTAGTPGLALVEADAERLPFRSGSLQVVTCSHAFYEFKGEGAERTLQEVVRVLVRTDTGRSKLIVGRRP